MPGSLALPWPSLQEAQSIGPIAGGCQQTGPRRSRDEGQPGTNKQKAGRGLPKSKGTWGSGSMCLCFSCPHKGIHPL